MYAAGIVCASSWVFGRKSTSWVLERLRVTHRMLGGSVEVDDSAVVVEELKCGLTGGILRQPDLIRL